MGSTHSDLESVFHRALEIKDQAARDEFLETACQDNTALRQRLIHLLKAHEQAHGFMENPSIDLVWDEHEASPSDNDTASLLQPAKGGSDPRVLVRRHLPRIPGYKIVGIIGQGGMGIVYRAVQTKLNRTVALKVLPAIVGAANPSAIERFKREAKSAARLHHTNIVPIYDFGESHDAHYFAMELIAGDSLEKIIKRFRNENVVTASAAHLLELIRPVSPVEPSDDEHSAHFDTPSSRGSASSGGRGRPYYRQVAAWMADAANALHYAHGEGIIHRDIKPGNLIISEEGRILVADFGLAKENAQESVTMTGSLMGTLRYMSPEQAMARRMHIDHRTDIYSLGATFYELLTFEPAFKGQDDKEILGSIVTRDPVAPRKIVSSVPRELETICMKMMEKAPQARYDTARALAEDLGRYIQDIPIVAQRPGLATRSIKFIRRRKAPVIAACALLIAGMAATLAVRSHTRENAAAVRQIEAEVQQLLVMAKAAAGEQNWELAEQKLSSALTKDPQNVNALIWKALIRKDAFNQGGQESNASLLAEATDHCKQALEIEPENETALNLLGVVQKMGGDLDGAADAYKRVMELGPEFYAPWVNLGTIRALQGDLEEAERYLRKAVALAKMDDKNAVFTWRSLAALLFHQGKAREAAENIDLALDCHREDAASLLLKARIQLVNDPSKAADTATTASFLAHESDPKAKRILALARLATGQFEASQTSAQDALSLGDMPTINHLIIAIASARLGDASSAGNHLQHARDVWPKDLTEVGAYQATADKGVLWFDTAEELNRLLQTAESAEAP